MTPFTCLHTGHLIQPLPHMDDSQCQFPMAKRALRCGCGADSCVRKPPRPLATLRPRRTETRQSNCSTSCISALSSSGTVPQASHASPQERNLEGIGRTLEHELGPARGSGSASLPEAGSGVAARLPAAGNQATTQLLGEVLLKKLLRKKNCLPARRPVCRLASKGRGFRAPVRFSLSYAEKR